MPALTTIVTWRTTRARQRDLQALAERRGTTVSDLIRIAIEQILDENRPYEKAAG